jgi:glycosyltransferase involved in cell wall biosynthesis
MYRERESTAIRDGLNGLIASHRPDVLLIGRESFAWDGPEIARSHGLPSVMAIRGGSRTAKLFDGGYPEVLGQRLLREYRKTALLITVAEHLTESLLRLGFSIVKTIPNAVDLGRFYPRPKEAGLLRVLDIRAGDVVVMHVANFQARKRSLDLVTSAQLALERDRRLVYVMVGDGPLRQVMEGACRQARIHGRFRYVGWVEYGRVPDYINLADIVVMPSESEGLSRVYLETQACGRLLLASDIPPAREVIVHGETGFLFRTADIEDLTAKTLLAACDADLRAGVGRKARESAEARSLDRAVAAYAAALSEVARQPAR